MLIVCLMTSLKKNRYEDEWVRVSNSHPHSTPWLHPTTETKPGSLSGRVGVRGFQMWGGGLVANCPSFLAPARKSSYNGRQILHLHTTSKHTTCISLWSGPLHTYTRLKISRIIDALPELSMVILRAAAGMCVVVLEGKHSFSTAT